MALAALEGSAGSAMDGRDRICSSFDVQFHVKVVPRGGPAARTWGYRCIDLRGWANGCVGFRWERAHCRMALCRT
eukprot:3188012-Prymnesium_polylepis.1